MFSRKVLEIAQTIKSQMELVFANDELKRGFTAKLILPFDDLPEIDKTISISTHYILTEYFVIYNRGEQINYHMYDEKLIEKICVLLNDLEIKDNNYLRFCNLKEFGKNFQEALNDINNEYVLK